MHQSPEAIIARLRARGLLDVVQRICAEHFAPISQVVGRGRTKSLIAARFACWAAIRERGLSLPEIGQLWDRDHTTIMAGLHKTKRDRGEKAA